MQTAIMNRQQYVDIPDESDHIITRTTMSRDGHEKWPEPSHQHQSPVALSSPSSSSSMLLQPPPQTPDTTKKERHRSHSKRSEKRSSSARDARVSNESHTNSSTSPDTKSSSSTSSSSHTSPSELSPNSSHQHHIDMDATRSRSASIATTISTMSRSNSSASRSSSTSISPQPTFVDLSACSNEALQQQQAFARSNANVPREQPTATTKLKTPPAKYDTFGETVRVDVAATMEHLDNLSYWLRIHGFDTAVDLKLDAAGHTTIHTLLRISKNELKSLLGPRDGIMIYQRLRDVEEALGANPPPMPISRPRITSVSCLPIQPDQLESGLRDTREYVVHQPGLYGYCITSKCDLPATSLCCQKGCERPLCIAHASKLLLTGAIVCESCYEKIGMIENVSNSIGLTALKENGYITGEYCTIQ